MIRNKIIKLTVRLAAAVLIFFAGVFATRSDSGLARNMEIMLNLMRELSTGYVDEISADELMKNGAAGMTSALDPYTKFLPEEEMSDFQTLTTGKYGGIGSLIRQDSDYVKIAEPYYLSPADKAGLQIGDKIVEINGTSAKGMTTSDVSSRLKGEPNTTVNLKVKKLVSDEIVSIKLRREQIKLPCISYFGYVAQGIGYIRHDDFTDTCYDDMRQAILSLQSEQELKMLVLDYRGNGGGVLQSAVKILSLFLPKGTEVVTTKGKNEAERKYCTEYEPVLPDLPLAVLIGPSTASAAEIVSGSLQDMDRAVLVGHKSFGKGLVQATHPLGYNAYIKMTTAKYYIPSGRCIQAIRYTPDGKAEQVPDSLINEFRTKAGRKIFDGGGIMPDIKVDPEYASAFATTLYLQGLLDEFGDRYFKLNHAQHIDPQTFSITDSDYEDFTQLVSQTEVLYKSDSRRALEVLKKALKRERHQEMDTLVDQIDQGLKDDKLSNLVKYKTEIVKAINSNIILRYAYSRGVIRANLKDDIQLDKAVECLRDTAVYARILREQDTQKK